MTRSRNGRRGTRKGRATPSHCGCGRCHAGEQHRRDAQADGRPIDAAREHLAEEAERYYDEQPFTSLVEYEADVRVYGSRWKQSRLDLPMPPELEAEVLDLVAAMLGEDDYELPVKAAREARLWEKYGV